MTDSSLRDRLWNHLADVKFQALYTCECSKRAGKYGRIFSFILAVTSIASAATWTILQQHPFVWAAVVVIAQVFQIAKPFIRFFKNEMSFLEMSFKYEELYLDCEKLWFANEKGEMKPKSVERRFYQCRQAALNIEKIHKDVVCPEPKRWVRKVTKQAHDALRLNFIHGETLDD